MTTVRRPIAIVVSRFPLVTETFILRELIELEKQGQPVVLVPLLRETPRVVHEEARPWIARAVYTTYVSWPIVRANLRAFLHRPRRYLSLLARLAAGAIASPATLLKTMALWPKSVYLASRLADLGVRHIHAHFATHPATAAYVAAQLTDATYSITVHAHDLFVDRTLLAPKVRRAAFVRCISEFNRTFLFERIPDLDPAKVTVIHVGVPRADAGTIEPMPAGEPVVLCIAALKPYKGVSYLLEACHLLAQRRVRFDCRIIGDGPLRSSLEERARGLGLERHVRFEGARPQQAVAQAIHQAAVVVHPSVVAASGQMDGIPVALMEAMAAARPVIASALSGIPELVEHERSGLLVRPGDVAALAAAVERILDDPALAARLGAAGAVSVRRAFDLMDTVARLVDRIDPLNPPIELPAPLPAARVQRVIATADAELIELAGGPPEAAWLLKRHRGGLHNGRGPADRARTEFEALTKIEADRVSAPRAWSGLAAPRPLALDVRDASVLMTQCRGTRLDALIRKARAGPPDAVRQACDALERTGRWLRTSQRISAPANGVDALASLNRRAAADLERCVADRVLPPHAAGALGALDKLAAHIPVSARAPVFAHGDFWPGNVLIGDDVAVVDFEAVDAGFRYEDAGYFLIHLDLYFRRPWSRTQGRRLAAAFLRGFSGDAAIDGAALRLARITAALRALANSTYEAPLLSGALRQWLFRSIVLDACAPHVMGTRDWQLAEAR